MYESQSSIDLEQEVRKLLAYAQWRGTRLHGKTIRAVMRRVSELRRRVQKQKSLVLVKKAG